MVKYSVEPKNATKASKARGSHLRVHFKHCREVCHAIKGITIINIILCLYLFKIII